MNGKFELDVTHKIDEDLKKDTGYIIFNPVAVELTRIAVENKKKPEEVVTIFKRIQKELLK